MTEAMGAPSSPLLSVMVGQLLVWLAPFGCVRVATLVPSPLVPLQQQTVADGWKMSEVDHREPENSCTCLESCV